MILAWALPLTCHHIKPMNSENESCLLFHCSFYNDNIYIYINIYFVNSKPSYKTLVKKFNRWIKYHVALSNGSRKLFYDRCDSILFGCAFCWHRETYHTLLSFIVFPVTQNVSLTLAYCLPRLGQRLVFNNFILLVCYFTGRYGELASLSGCGKRTSGDGANVTPGEHPSYCSCKLTYYYGNLNWNVLCYYSF